MYRGIKRKEHKMPKIKYPTKHQIIQLEEVETNGIISKNYVIKTHDYAADPNIRYQDFEVANLTAAGIDVQRLGEVKMSPSVEKLQNNAETANQVLDEYEIIKELEQQRNETNEKPKETAV